MECISDLTLTILDENKPLCDRNDAYNKLKLRSGYFANEILSHDRSIVNGRGTLTSNYLLSNNVSMQKLMETYFSYVSLSSSDERNMSGLLFSEICLCNQMFFRGEFFYKLYKREIKRLEGIADSKSLTEEERFKILTTLHNHEMSIISQISQFYSKNNKFYCNEGYRILLNKENTSTVVSNDGTIEYYIDSISPLLKFYIYSIVK